MGAELRPSKLGLEEAGVKRFLAKSGATIQVQDAAEAAVMTLEAHVTRHKSGGADPLAKADIKTLLDAISGIVSIDPPSIATIASADVAVTVAGLTTDHKVIVQCQEALENGLVCIAAWVSAADQLTVRITNWSAAAVDGVARSWAYFAYIP